MKSARVTLLFFAALLCGTLALPGLSAAMDLKMDISARDDGVRRPVVFIVQGTGSVGGREAGWAQWFNGQGVAAVVLCSAESRGLRNFAGSHVSDYSEDLVQALACLENDSRIDTRRFAIIGFSRGGTVALISGKRFKSGPARPALVFAFYPGTPYGCTNEHDAGTEVHIFYGSADEWGNYHGLLNACRKLVNENVFFHEFPDAQHGFDGPTSAQFESGGRMFRLAPNSEATAAAKGIIAEALARTWGELPR